MNYGLRSLAKIDAKSLILQDRIRRYLRSPTAPACPGHEMDRRLVCWANGPMGHALHALSTRLATRFRSDGRTSSSNQGFRRGQRLLRGLEWGRRRTAVPWSRYDRSPMVSPPANGLGERATNRFFQVPGLRILADHERQLDVGHVRQQPPTPCRRAFGPGR